MSDIIEYFNVKLKTFNQVNKQRICWYVNYVDFKMHGETIKIINAQQSKPCNRSDIIEHFNVNLRLLTKLINSEFVGV